MAAVAVAADNVRIAEANITNDTGTWGNDGGGGGVADEPDFYYQGGTGALTAQSRKVSTSRIGRSYTHGTGTNMQTTDRKHCIMKLLITNKDALLTRTAPAAGLKIGSASGAYWEYYLFGSDLYPKRGGFQIIAICPDVLGYRDATQTNPSIANILYWSFLADFGSASKSENLIIDAIDIGAGLVLTGGDGADTDGVYQDFLDADEGTTANSWGYVYSEGDAIFVTGRLAIGENTSGTAVATVFNDSDRSLFWNNGLVETGFNQHNFNLGNASTAITLNRCSYISQGEPNNTADRGYTTTEDSRTELNVTNTAGTFTANNCNFNNFRSFSLNSACTMSACNFINSGQVDAGSGATLTNCGILNSAVATDGSALLWNNANDPNGELDGMAFSQGTNAHHAIEFGTNAPLSITLTDIDFTGFTATNGQNNSTFYVKRTSGTVTINISGGSGNLSYKTDGATVNIVQNPVTTTVKCITTGGANISGALVRLEASNGTGPLPYQESISMTRSGSTVTVTHTGHGLATNNYVRISGTTERDYNGVWQITVTDANTYTFNIGSRTPTSPATGSPVSTAILVYGTTNASGEVSDTRTLSSAQPVTGVARKSTTSPLYVQADINGTASNSSNTTFNVTMVSDEG